MLNLVFTFYPEKTTIVVCVCVEKSEMSYLIISNLLLLVCGYTLQQQVVLNTSYYPATGDHFMAHRLNETFSVAARWSLFKNQKIQAELVEHTAEQGNRYFESGYMRGIASGKG